MAAQRRRRSNAAAAKRKPAERVGLGGGAVDKHLARSKKRRSNIYTSVGDGNTIVVRAVNTKKLFKDGYVHPVEFERKDGSTFTMDIRCLDPEEEGNPCPGCKDDLEKRYKFWMVVIHRDAPVENSSGKVIKEEDQVRILSGASRLVKVLNAKHKRRDLTKRDIEVSQTGTGFDVEYDAEWADEEDIPLSEEDEQLIEDAEEVLEAFERYTELRDIDNFYDLPQFNNKDDEDEDIGEKSKRRKATFGERKDRAKVRSRRKVVDDEDKEESDDEDTTSRPRKRRTIKQSKASSSAKTTTRRRVRR